MLRVGMGPSAGLAGRSTADARQAGWSGGAHSAAAATLRPHERALGALMAKGTDRHLVGETRPQRNLKRQFGCERRTGALPVVDRYPGGGELTWARALLLFTLAGFVVYLVEWVQGYSDQEGPMAIAEAWVYLILIATLTASASGYLIARLGYISRIRGHRRTPRKLIDDAFDRYNPTLTVVVPSLREEPRVVRQTLLSAALQEYPGLRVALLIDDPPNPATPEQTRLLESARALPGEIDALLRTPRARFEAALNAFESTAGSRVTVPPAQLVRLADTYDEAVPDRSAGRESAVLRPAAPAEGPMPTLSILESPSASAKRSERPAR